MKRRVVVTGYGVISPPGNYVESLWNNIKNGKSGIQSVESEEFKEINTRIAGFLY